MSDLPAPPVPAELDLRDFRWMKLDLIALFNSDFNATPDDTAWRAGVTLWGKSWHQVPAGSLPNDDPTLCNLAGLGRDLKTWRKIRATALRGFSLCSDSRLYHSYVCKMALDADEERRSFQERRAKDRERKKVGKSDHGQSEIQQNSVGIPASIQANSIGSPVEFAVEGQGQGQGQGDKKDSELRSGADAPLDPKAELWKDGLATLRRITNQERGPAAKLLGKLLDVAGADHARLLELIRRAEVEQPDGPQAWLMAGAKAICGAPSLPLNALPELPPSFNPPDAWGVRAWVRSLSGVEIGKDQRGNDAYLLAGVCIEDIALDVLNDAKIPLTSRPNLESLAGWLRDDLNPKTISTIIRRLAGRAGYEPVGALAYFDKPVREGHGRAAA